jgi:peptide/nickel transport system permease protein
MGVATSLPVRRDRAPEWTKSPAIRALREIARRPSGGFGLAVVLILFFAAAFAPVLTPYRPDAVDVPNQLLGPSAQHLLGTDQLGRDLLSRLIVGSRISVSVAVPAVLLALVLGLVIGLVSGYLGGVVDNAVVVAMDSLQAFPWVILALALIALLGPSLTNLVLVLMLGYIPPYGRVCRALVLSTKENQFVEAERALGASALRVTLIHVLPNVVAPCLILAAMDLPSAIAAEAGLSFLGLGVQPPAASWGNILSDGFGYVRQSPWAVIAPGVTLMIVTLGITLLGETLRDVIDPRLAGSRRWRRM